MKERDRERTESYIKHEHLPDAGSYYIVPSHKIAIPVGKTSVDTMLTELGKRGDYTLPNEITYYPTVSHVHLITHFAEYEIIPLLKEVLVTKPVSLFSGWEAGIVERQRKIRAEQLIEERAQAKRANNPFA